VIQRSDDDQEELVSEGGNTEWEKERWKEEKSEGSQSHHNDLISRILWVAKKNQVDEVYGKQSITICDVRVPSGLGEGREARGAVLDIGYWTLGVRVFER